MNTRPSKLRLIAVVVAPVASVSLLLAEDESPFRAIERAKEAKERLEKVQWAKHDYIEELEKPPPPNEGGPLTEAEKRANALHFLKANQKVERQKLAEVKALQDKLLATYTSTDHQASPSLASLKRIMKLNKEINAKLNELAEPQEAAERLMGRLHPDRVPPDSERSRTLLREAAREITNRAILEVQARRQQARGQTPSMPQGHHHPGR